MPDTIIRLRQKGYARATGYQTVNWAVTVPVSDPSGTPRIGTTPDRFFPLFVVRNTGASETYERVARLEDFVEEAPPIPVEELEYFDVRGAGGRELYVSGRPLPGDILTFPGASAFGSLAHWLEDAPPYANNAFTVLAVVPRVSGSGPQALPGNRVHLPGMAFTPEDRNSWVMLSGFPTDTYNGPAQILDYTSSIATVDKSISTTQTGGTWWFPRVRIQAGTDPAVEPRYFPTKVRNVAWALHRGGTPVVSRPSGGRTERRSGLDLVRSVRYTELALSVEAGLDRMVGIRRYVAMLQREAARENTTFTALMTSTYGP